MEDYNPNDFNKKVNEFNTELPGRMYIFAITKFCGYSTFVYMYKDETLTDLYTRVSHHFQCKDIKGLYIDNQGSFSTRFFRYIYACIALRSISIR